MLFQACRGAAVIARANPLPSPARHPLRQLHYRSNNNDWIRRLRDRKAMDLASGTARAESGRPAPLAEQEDGQAPHHDTHAMPPVFVQEACWQYNKMKRAELDAAPQIIDFDRGLSEAQSAILRPAGVIPSEQIHRACENFWKAAGRDDYTPRDPIADVSIYEHEHFPGLQLIPGLIPRDAQHLFVSQVLHRDLANPSHITNLHDDMTLPADLPSLFTLDPSSTLTTSQPSSTPKSPITTATALRKLRYLTLGTQYHWPTRSYPRTTSTPFPADLSALVTTLFPHITPQSGVCLAYGSKDLMPVHRDVSEQCERALASLSFGCDGLFLIARGEEDTEDPVERDRRVVVVRVRSGDVVHLDGEARWAWHAMPRCIPGTVRDDALRAWPAGSDEGDEGQRRAYERWKGWFGAKRLNVSCRQVWD